MNPPDKAEGVNEQDIDAIFNSIGFGSIQVWIFITTGLLLFFASNEVMGISIIMIAAEKEFDLTDLDRSIVSSASIMGMIISAPYIGYKTDDIGRRRMLLISTIPSLFICVISAFMPNFWAFVVLRFLAGMFLVAFRTVNLTYLAEFCTDELRPTLLNSTSYFIGLSMVYMPAMASLIIPLDFHWLVFSDYEIRPWRILLLLYSLPGLTALIILCFLPESPKFLLSIGKIDEAYNLLNALCLKNKGYELKSVGIKTLNKSSSHTSLEKGFTIWHKMWQAITEIFHPPYLLKFLHFSAIMFGLFFIGNGLGIWFAELRNDAVAINKTETFCELLDINRPYNVLADATNADTYIDAIILGVSILIGCILLTLMLLYMHRVHVISVYLAISTLSGLCLNFVEIDEIVVTLFALFIVMPTDIICLFSSVILDFVPTHLRCMTVNLVIMVGRIGMIIASILIGLFMRSSCMIMLNVFVFYISMCAILSWFLPK